MSGTTGIRAAGRLLTPALAAWLMASTALYAAPPIRTSETNRVPSCVSPQRLMDFIKTRNPDVDPRYRDIARWYKYWGEAWHVRWDYAFFQMAIETNYLKYRRGNGQHGDVNAKQNNFAGIGATGGGVAGERFQDVKTGVHAQIQHLVAYSGEHVADPVARRTGENQDDIIARSRRLGRPVTFGDLARRWAADRQYAKSIDFVASQFWTNHCKGPATADNVPVPQPAHRPARPFPAPSGLGGPKMQKLAGPEALPWDDGAPVGEDGAGRGEEPAPAKPEKTVPPKPEQAKRPSAVRTLWSRTKPVEHEAPAAGREPIAPQPHAPNSQPAAAAPPPATHNPSDKHVAAPAETRPAIPAETAAIVPAAPQPSPTPPVEAVEAAGAEPAPLPHFRIAPSRPEPAHLGGPVDPAPVAGGANLAVSPPAQIGACRLLTASYGGTKTLLVRASKGGEVQLTALTVLDGFEQSMLDTFAKATPGPLNVVGTYPSKDEALAEGKRLCPGPQT